MVFDAFFSWRIVGLLRGFGTSNDSVFACAHGDCECLRLDACAGFTERMEPGVVELRVNDTASGGMGECLRSH